MGLEELRPGNTKRAKATAIKAFKTFVKGEDVDFAYVKQCVERDATGQCLVSVLDKFGMHLAFNEGKKGKPLARNTSMQYYRQSKMWLFELFPAQRHIVEAKLLSMRKTLENFCMKRDGKVVNKAAPCSKRDLKNMMLYLYTNASTSSDYQDATLLCLLWYLFGRASDLSLVLKQNLSIDAAEILFVRFIRLKTSEEQGLSLFPDADFATCPLYTIALALITQAAPSADQLDNLPRLPVHAAVTLSPATPLIEILDHPGEYAALGATAQAAGGPTAAVEKTPTIYTHVNRLLNRIATAAGVQASLTSHSFRRGGAQHVNGCDGLTQRWIFDRGAWNMSTTNKCFNYIFNTSREDHKVCKALSGYNTEAKVPLQNLEPFDAYTQEKIAAVQRYLFATCHKLERTKYNVNQRVLDVLMAYLILHYPQLKQLHPDGPATKLLEVCVELAGSSVADLLAWSAHLATASCKPTTTPTHDNADSPPHKQHSDANKTIDHQRSVIDQLVQHIKRQDERMDLLEAKLVGSEQQDKLQKRQQELDQEQDNPPKRRRTSVTHLHATWYAWYAQEPRWLADAPKRHRSNAKQLVALMKLFFEDGIKVDPSAADYRDQVLASGKQAEAATLAYLSDRGIKSRDSTAVRKHLHDLYTSGSFNDKIARHQQLHRAGAIQDPDRQGVLEPVASMQASD